MVKTLCIVVALSVLSGLPWAPGESTAVAQQQAPTERARRLFEEGLALAQSDRWAEALSAFRRSAELVSRPSTSYNIANALYRLDRPVEGLEELDRYDAMPEVKRSESARARSAALRPLMQRAVGEAQLLITPSGAEVFVDGRPIEGSGAQRRIPLNPGSHSIRVTHAGYEADRREIEVSRGSRQSYRIELTPETSDPSVAIALPPSSISLGSDALSSSAPQAQQDERKPFVKRPGFWVMIGAIAAVGIGTGVAVALGAKDDSPQCGTTGNCASTQGLSVASF
jgi:hypothetical protein